MYKYWSVALSFNGVTWCSLKVAGSDWELRKELRNSKCNTVLSFPLFNILSMPCFLPHWLSPCSYNHLLFSPSPQPPSLFTSSPLFFFLALYQKWFPLLTSPQFILVLCLLAAQGGCHLYPPPLCYPPLTLPLPPLYTALNNFHAGNLHLLLSLMITFSPVVAGRFSLGQRCAPSSSCLSSLSFSLPLPHSVHLSSPGHLAGIFSAEEAYVLALASVLGFISAGVRGLSLRGCTGVTATVEP